MEIQKYINEIDGNGELNTSLISKRSITSVTMINRDIGPVVRIVTNEQVGLMSDGKDSMYFIIYPDNAAAISGYEDIRSILAHGSTPPGEAPKPAFPTR
jgi:hypothetical protein